METIVGSANTAVAASPAVDIKQFTALEQRVDALVVLLQQLALPTANSGKKSPKRGKPNLIPGFPSFPGVLTPETLPETPDVGLLETQDNFAASNSVNVPERPSDLVASQILNIIQRYGNNIAAEGDAWPGRTKFMPMVEAFVSKCEPVLMVLPAFPFKSPNRKAKTLGALPDLGEEYALMHLNGLCESIEEIYEHGANVVIASDGLVYNGKFCHGSSTIGLTDQEFRPDGYWGQRGLGLLHSCPTDHRKQRAASSEDFADRGPPRTPSHRNFG